MVSWNILHSSLPLPIKEAVLRINEVAPNSPEWTLLRSGNTRNIYHYTPKGEVSYLVKWACRHTFSQTCKALLIPTDAEREAKAIKRAIHANIPTPPVLLAASSSLLQRPFYTLLVTEFLDGSRDLLSVMKEELGNDPYIKRLFSDLAALIVNTHKAGFMHGDLTATNVLVEPKGKLQLIDLLTLHNTGNNINQFFRDVGRMVFFMWSANVSRHHIRHFLNEYMELMGFADGRYDMLIERALKKPPDQCRHMACRASRNAIKRNRIMERFHYSGFAVYMIKGSDVSLVRRCIDQARKKQHYEHLKTHMYRAQTWSFRDSPLLHSWRMQLALALTDMESPGAIAFARSFGFPRDELLIYHIPSDTQGMCEALSEPSFRQDVLKAFGNFLSCLHSIGISLTGLDISTWSLIRKSDGTISFFTTDLQAFTFYDVADSESRFRWLLEWFFDAGKLGLGVRELVILLRAYCRGKIEKELWLCFNSQLKKCRLNH